MDSKIKIFTILAFTICSVVLTGCKQNNWMDWKLQNELWLQANKTQPGVRTTSSGLQYKIIEDPGKENGEPQPNITSTIVCDYRLQLINGYVLESRGPTFGGTESVAFNLSSTIPGFSEGCHKIHNHGDIELYIPAYLGYDYSYYESGKYGKAKGSGTEGTTGYIPPYSTLIYTIHLCSVAGN